MLALTEADADKTIDVVVDDTVEIKLRENATAGYRWTLETIDRLLCSVVTEERHGPDQLIPGAPGIHVWRIKAEHVGDCQIKITYARTWQRGAPPAQTFNVRLRVRI